LAVLGNRVQILHDAADTLRSLLEVGEQLAVRPGRQQALDLILHEARSLTRAEAGTLYVRRDEELEFVAVQNDRLDVTELREKLLGQRMDVSSDSLAGFVASTGRIENLPDVDNLPSDAPFRVNRDLDKVTGYEVRTVLALPLNCLDGPTVGVLELFNRVDVNRDVQPFPDSDTSGILSLAAMAALAIHNTLLQEQIEQAHLNTIVRLTVAAEFRDQVTAEHLRRISHTSGMIARAMKLDQRQVELIQSAAPMHDIGKIGVPDSILRKPGPLEPHERQIIQQHPATGAEIIGASENELIAAAREIALTHHERWDGLGYPQGLVAEDIPLAGRIVAVADALDALVSERPYKKAIDLQRSLAAIRDGRGTAYDPQVVDALLSVTDEVVEYYSSASPARVQTDAGVW
jgi:HD-GYP domain-containing protein (c-di-GMP phosphodiesterase class II)